MGFIRCLGAGGVLILLNTLGVFAQLPLARLSSVYPPGGPQGGTVRVTAQGADLDGADSLWFSDARLQATPVVDAALTWLVKIPAEVPPGRLDLRVRGRFGLSNPRAFMIGALPERGLTATNLTAASAAELPPETILNGRMPAGAELWFRLQLEADQQLVIRVNGRELDSRLDPVLTLQDPAGAELETSRRGWLACTATRAGVWRLRLHDLTFRGGDEYGFRLCATAGPQIAWAWPPVVEPGRRQRVTLLGRHLPEGRPTRVRGEDGQNLEAKDVEVDVPWEAGRGGTGGPPGSRLASAGVAGWRWTPEGGLASGGFLFLALRRETNLVVGPMEGFSIIDVDPPCEVWGLCPPRGQSGGVRFRARKGEVWWVEAQSEQLGYGTDPALVIQRAAVGEGGNPNWSDVAELLDQDTNFGDPVYDTRTRDPAGRFEAPEDGEYRILVRDLFHRSAAQPRYPYRLILRRESPGFALVAHPVMPPPADPNQRPARPWVTLLRRGETLPVRVLAFRRDGFDGDLELRAEGLPAGVTAKGGRILAGRNSGILLLQAAEDAAAWSGVIRVAGRSSAGGREIESEAAAASVVWGVDDYQAELACSRWTDGLGLAVSAVESAPVIVEALGDQPIEAVEKTGVTVPLRVVRHGDFTADLKFKVQGHPELEKLAELVVSGTNRQAALEIPLKERPLAPGVHTFYLQALAAGKYRNQPEVVALAEAELRAAEQAVASASGEEKPRAEAARKAAEDRMKAAEERARPRDVQVAVYSRPITLRIRPAPQP